MAAGRKERFISATMLSGLLKPKIYKLDNTVAEINCYNMLFTSNLGRGAAAPWFFYPNYLFHMHIICLFLKHHFIHCCPTYHAVYGYPDLT